MHFGILKALNIWNYMVGEMLWTFLEILNITSTFPCYFLRLKSICRLIFSIGWYRYPWPWPYISITLLFSSFVIFFSRHCNLLSQSYRRQLILAIFWRQAIFQGISRKPEDAILAQLVITYRLKRLIFWLFLLPEQCGKDRWGPSKRTLVTQSLSEKISEKNSLEKLLGSTWSWGL